MDRFTFNGYTVSIASGGTATIRHAGKVVHVSRGVGSGRTVAQAREAARSWITSEIERKRRYTPSEMREIVKMRKRAAGSKRTAFGRFGK